MRWRSLHLLSVGDDPMPLLLRWADTRTLAVLPGVLTPPQWSAIAGPLVHWIFLNREGVAQACPQAAAAPDAESTDIGPLILSDDQVQRLIDEAEADALHSNLVSQLIASGAALPRPSAIYRLTRAALDKADKAGISNMKDRTSLALAACVTAGGALGSSRLEALLQSREWPSGDLFNALLRARVIAINAVPGSESADMH